MSARSGSSVASEPSHGDVLPHVLPALKTRDISRRHGSPIPAFQHEALQAVGAVHARAGDFPAHRRLILVRPTVDHTPPK